MSWATAAYISTIVLAVAAIIAGYLARRNLSVLREQHRYNTLLSLMDDLSSESARKSREIISVCMEPDTNGQYLEEIPINMVWNLIPFVRTEIGSVGVINSIEETVNCLDKVGFSYYKATPN